MVAQSPVFQNFWLPNATTWFYFSLLLAVALFFKFSRLLSVRNWDVVTVFLLVPGMLLIEDAQPTASQQRLDWVRGVLDRNARLRHALREAP